MNTEVTEARNAIDAPEPLGLASTEGLGRGSEARNHWRDAIDEALVVSCLDCIGPEETPTEALARLIHWEKVMALDPKISKEAEDLCAENERLRAALAQSCDEHRSTIYDSGPGGGCPPLADAVAEMRERCAMVCETLPGRSSIYDAATLDCAAAIRAEPNVRVEPQTTAPPNDE